MKNINFCQEIKPFIIEYMNRVFRAYDGYGARIVFYNGVTVHWDFDDNSNITKVTLQTDNYDVIGTTEEHFADILSMVTLFAVAELDHQEQREKIDQQYVNMIKKIKGECEKWN